MPDTILLRAHGGESSPPTVWLLPPPYDGLPEPFVNPTGKREGRLKRGALLVIRPPPGAGWSTVAGEADRWLSELPATPVVLWLDQLEREQHMEVYARARATGIRACVTAPAFTRSALRVQLSDPALLAPALPLWVGRRGKDLDLATKERLADLALRVAEHRTFGELMLARGDSTSSWYRGFRRCAIAPPGAWFHVVRIICIGLEIQRAPRIRIDVFVERFGFYDQAHLRHRCWEVLGAPIAQVRNDLGWEWMLHAACARSGLLRARPRDQAPRRPS